MAYGHRRQIQRSLEPTPNSEYCTRSEPATCDHTTYAPDDAVEPHDVFANDVHISRPAQRSTTVLRVYLDCWQCRQRRRNPSHTTSTLPKLVALFVVLVRIVDAGDVIGQGIKPYVPDSDE